MPQPLTDVFQQACLDAMEAGYDADQFLAAYRKAWEAERRRDIPQIELDRVREFWQHLTVIRETMAGLPPRPDATDGSISPAEWATDAAGQFDEMQTTVKWAVPRAFDADT